MGGYRAGALVAMMVFGFALSIMALCGVQIEWLMMFYNFLGVLFFTMYIVFYTQMIVGGNHQVQFSIDDYVFASLYLYVDISNLFLHLIRLLADSVAEDGVATKDRLILPGPLQKT